MGVSNWVQVPQVEKRVQRSCVVGSHEREGSKEKEECTCAGIRAEAGVVASSLGRRGLDKSWICLQKDRLIAMGRAVQCGGERRMSVAWRRDNECAREPCRISWASSVQGLGQPLDCSSAFPVCARPRGSEISAPWQGWGSFPGWQWDTCSCWPCRIMEGMAAVCPVWVWLLRGALQGRGVSSAPSG